jgi:hypothetical protein
MEQQIEQITSAWRLSATPFLSELSISASNPIFIQISNPKSSDFEKQNCICEISGVNSRDIAEKRFDSGKDNRGNRKSDSWIFKPKISDLINFTSAVVEIVVVVVGAVVLDDGGAAVVEAGAVVDDVAENDEILFLDFKIQFWKFRYSIFAFQFSEINDDFPKIIIRSKFIFFMISRFRVKSADPAQN